MNPNYIHTITVYNRMKAKDTATKKEEWYKTVIPDCSWRCSTEDIQQQVQSGITNRDQKEIYIVRVPRNEKFRSYEEWKKAPAEYFALSKQDIIILGECQDEITGISPDTATEVMQRHKPDAFLIRSFADNTSHLVGKHYKVGG